MLRLFKTVVLYLSVLAMPLQGYAASTMLYCGPSHQHTTMAHEAAHGLPHGHANNPAADHLYQVHATVSLDSIGHASSDDAGNFASDDLGLEKKNGKLGAHDSSEHAACFVGAAIPASGLRFQPADQAIERISSKQFLSIGFVTDGPRRPPRSFLV